MQINFNGPTYPSRSNSIDSDRAINFYPELDPQDEKSVMALIGTSGTSLFASVGASPIRGKHVFASQMFVVSGVNLYSINLARESSLIGTIGTSSGRVSMTDNGLAAAGIGGNQLIIVDGAAGYIYDVSTSTFSTISGGGWPGSASMVAFMDGYFIAIVLGSMSHYVSNLYDGTAWSALATSPVEASPSVINALTNLHQQLWFIKDYDAEVWYDAGTSTATGSPFNRISGAVIDYGIAAPFSLAKGDNSLFWLAQERNNEQGLVVGIVEVSGYVPTIISPISINYQISNMAVTSDAFAYFYSADGHKFYVLTFPTANWTVVYDATNGLWHERSTYVEGGLNMPPPRHIGNSYAYFGGKHLVGDWQAGNIFEMHNKYYSDNGLPIISTRIAQHLSDRNDLDNIFIAKLQIDAQVGVGSASGNDPQAMLSWSNDGGYTYGNEYMASIGKLGEYLKRLTWRKLGYARDRVWKLSISDPCQKVILGAYVE